jgi:hypothetical protein
MYEMHLALFLKAGCDRLSQVRHHFFYLSGLFRNFCVVRKIVVPKIGASGDYLKFIARANTNSEA